MQRKEKKTNSLKHSKEWAQRYAFATQHPTQYNVQNTHIRCSVSGQTQCNSPLKHINTDNFPCEFSYPCIYT